MDRKTQTHLSPLFSLITLSDVPPDPHPTLGVDTPLSIPLLGGVHFIGRSGAAFQDKTPATTER
jgi:hypothetical protein